MEDLKLSSIVKQNIQQNNYENESKSIEKGYNLIRIIYTIEPSLFSIKILEKLIKNYFVDIILFDMSYNYDYKLCYDLIKKIRSIELKLREGKKNQWRPLIDIAIKIRGGHEIRTGLIDTTKSKTLSITSEKNDSSLSSSSSSNFIELKRNQIIELTTDKNYYKIGSENIIYINCDNITNIIKKINQIIVIGEDIDYRIVLIVKQIKSNSLICKVKVPNILRSFQRIYLPGVIRNDNLPLDIIDDTINDLKFAKCSGISIVFTSYMRDSSTINEIRKILNDCDNNNDNNLSSSSSLSSCMIFASISDLENLKNFDELLSVADGILLNRNELSIELPKQKLFTIQKSISAKCNRAGKICVFSASLLNSMHRNLTPTITEIFDVRNVILDDFDCILLNYETSIGNNDNPIEICKIIKDLSIETKSLIIENKISSCKRTINDNCNRNRNNNIMMINNETESIIMSAFNIAIQCNAACIITITNTGKSAKSLVKYNPPCPIIAVTQDIKIARKLFLNRDIWPIWPKIPVLYGFNNWMTNMEQAIEVALNFGKNMNIIQNGDCIIVAFKWENNSKFMNSIRILYANLSSDNNDNIDVRRKQKKNSYIF